MSNSVLLPFNFRSFLVIMMVLWGIQAMDLLTCKAECRQQNSESEHRDVEGYCRMGRDRWWIGVASELSPEEPLWWQLSSHNLDKLRPVSEVGHGPLMYAAVADNVSWTFSEMPMRNGVKGCPGVQNMSMESSSPWLCYHYKSIQCQVTRYFMWPKSFTLQVLVFELWRNSGSRVHSCSLFCFSGIVFNSAKAAAREKSSHLFEMHTGYKHHWVDAIKAMSHNFS